MGAGTQEVLDGAGVPGAHVRYFGSRAVAALIAATTRLLSASNIAASFSSIACCSAGNGHGAEPVVRPGPMSMWRNHGRFGSPFSSRNADSTDASASLTRRSVAVSPLWIAASAARSAASPAVRSSSKAATIGAKSGVMGAFASDLDAGCVREPHRHEA